MRKKFFEELLLFISILKWVFLGAFVGGIVGLSTTVFLKTLNLAIDFMYKIDYYWLFMPLAFLISSLLISYLCPEAEGHGTEKVIEAIHTRSGKINFLVVPVKLIASVITIASGGSAGKEGPSAQIGGGISSFLSDIFKFDETDRKKLVICGISAGFSSVFGTPIAGAIFGVEVLFIGSLLYEVLLPSFVAGIISYHVSSSLGIKYFYHPIEFVPSFTNLFFIKTVFAGIFFGISSLLLIETLNAGKKISERIKVNKSLKSIIGGFILIILTFIFSERYLGLGIETIQSCLNGEKILWYAFILKIIFTSITLNFGGSGGIITPIFFVGATFGAFLAHIFNFDTSTFSAIGLVSVLSGAANTPIAASIMGLELFGPKISPYIAISCIVSYFMTGHRSVYPSQKIGTQKTRILEIEIGKPVEEIHPHLKLRKKSLTYLILKFLRKIKKW